MIKRGSLKSELFIKPAAIIVLSFIIVIIVFNVAMTKYADKITSQHIKSEFSRFSLYMKEEKNRDFKKNNSGYDLETKYIIFDEKGKAVYPQPPWMNEGEKKTTGFLTKFYKKSSSELNDGKKIEFTYNNRIYHIQHKQYFGYYDGYLVFEADKNKKNHRYDILVYTDVTPLLEFGDNINIILCIIMGCTLLLSLAIMFVRARMVDKSFKSLNNYISLAGKREKLSETIKFPYNEFQDVAKTVRSMSDMIDRSEAAQKQFFANASHELKTPLMSIQGYAEGLETGVIGDRDKCVSIIISESQKMKSLINDILLLSRMDAAGCCGEIETFDIRDMVIRCCRSVENAASQHGVKIKYSLENASILFNGDENGLEHGILNILTNAVRYAESYIEVKCRKSDGKVLISVADDGVGISPEDLPHIFERFYKGDGGLFGIGLSITKEVVSLHNGEIAVATGGGETIFSIELPLNI